MPLTRREIGRRYRARHPERELAAHAKWRAANPDYPFEYRLRRDYGLSLQEYEEQLAAQGYACAICLRPASDFDRRLHVDHDHRTNSNRGLLCFDCNSAIGKLMDDPALLRRAADYLERCAP